MFSTVGRICQRIWVDIPRNVTKWPYTPLRQVVLSLVACCADDGRQGPSHGLTVGLFSNLHFDNIGGCQLMSFSLQDREIGHDMIWVEDDAMNNK